MIVQDTFATFTFILLFWVAGSNLQRFLKFDASRTTRNISSVYLGIYFYALLFSFLGLIHRLTVVNLVLTLILANVFFFFIFIRRRKNQKKMKSKFKLRKGRPVYFFYLFSAVLVYRNALHPIDGFDALAYHLYAPYSALYHTHKFNASDLVPNSGLPIGTDAVYGYLSLIGTPQTASIFNVFYVVTALIIVGHILRDKNFTIKLYSLTSVLSLFIFLGPIFSEPGTDLPLISVSLLVLSFYLEKMKNTKGDCLGSNATIIHVFLGLMIFTKPSTLIFAGTLWVVEVYLSASRKQSTFQLIKIAPITLAPITVWFAKNFIQTGNPIIPFGTHIFRGSGYGPEVTTTESDIRSSFQQVFNILIDKESYRFIINLSSAQNTTVIISVIFVTLVFYSVKFLVTVRKDSFLIAIVSSEILTLLISGPLFRYFGYLLTLHLVLLVYNSRNKKTKDLEKKNLNRINSVSLKVSKQVPALFFLSALGFLNIFNNTWNVEGNGPLAKTSRLSSGSTSAEQVIMYVRNKIDTNSNVCLIGDSRAMLFWPSKISFLPSNRVNPFADPAVLDNYQVVNRLKELRCDYLVVTSVWGLPSNVDLLKFKYFVAESKAMTSNDYYSVYDIGKLRENEI